MIIGLVVVVLEIPKAKLFAGRKCFSFIVLLREKIENAKSTKKSKNFFCSAIGKQINFSEM